MRLAVSIGCPSGIGAEVSVVAASELVDAIADASVVLVGDAGVIERAAHGWGIDRARFVRVDRADSLPASSRSSSRRPRSLSATPAPGTPRSAAALRSSPGSMPRAIS